MKVQIPGTKAVTGGPVIYHPNICTFKSLPFSVPKQITWLQEACGVLCLWKGPTGREAAVWREEDVHTQRSEGNWNPKWQPLHPGFLLVPGVFARFNSNPMLLITPTFFISSFVFKVPVLHQSRRTGFGLPHFLHTSPMVLICLWTPLIHKIVKLSFCTYFLSQSICGVLMNIKIGLLKTHIRRKNCPFARK